MRNADRFPTTCRELAPAAISAEEIERILDSGRRAPSGWNKQPLEYLVVRDRAKLAALFAALR